MAAPSPSSVADAKLPNSRTSESCPSFLVVPSNFSSDWEMKIVANHGKRARDDGYLGSEAVAGSISEQQEFGGVQHKKPRNVTRIAAMRPVSAKVKKNMFKDRLAELSKLLPFGKPNPASVLEDISAYIKFLHRQLQVLSLPYLHGPADGGAPAVSSQSQSPRSRGLCAAPVELARQLEDDRIDADLCAFAASAKRR